MTRKLKGALAVMVLIYAAAGAWGGGSSSSQQAQEEPIPDGPTSQPEVTLLPLEAAPAGAAAQFSTDFGRHTVAYREILSGGPPKDGIPSVDAPQFVSVAEADLWLEPQEPVVMVEISGEARAYPIQILTWHEIVNDTIARVPVAVTFCPLCNTGIVFESMVDSIALDFGTTGRLRYSNLIMYDRQTESWWQQATGEAIAGQFAGRRLRLLPAPMVSWSEFRTARPEGSVLSRQTGFSRSYGANPYAGYDNVNSSPFLYRGPRTSDALPAMARVLTVEAGGEAVAFPYEVLQAVGVVNQIIAGEPITVFWQAGTSSALDSRAIADGRDVGAAAAYARVVDGRTLTFALREGQIVDLETGTGWDVLGQALQGQLAGTQLTEVVAINHFWFSWAAFRPDTRVVTMEDARDLRSIPPSL